MDIYLFFYRIFYLGGGGIANTQPSALTNNVPELNT